MKDDYVINEYAIEIDKLEDILLAKKIKYEREITFLPSGWRISIPNRFEPVLTAICNEHSPGNFLGLLMVNGLREGKTLSFLTAEDLIRVLEKKGLLQKMEVEE